MIRFAAPILTAILLTGGCASPESPPLQATGVVAYAPLTDGGAGVLYAVLHNPGSEPRTVKTIGSPQFAAVSAHVTQVDQDGVARMEAADELVIPAGGDLVFAPGGLHLMLQNAVAPLPAGAVIAVEFVFDNGSVLRIETDLLSRAAATLPAGPAQ